MQFYLNSNFVHNNSQENLNFKSIKQTYSENMSEFIPKVVCIRPTRIGFANVFRNLVNTPFWTFRSFTNLCVCVCCVLGVQFTFRLRYAFASTTYFKWVTVERDHTTNIAQFNILSLSLFSCLFFFHSTDFDENKVLQNAYARLKINIKSRGKEMMTNMETLFQAKWIM